MPRFYFHIHPRDVLCADKDGANFETLDEALQFAQDLAERLARNSEFDMGSIIIVREKGGRVGRVRILCTDGTRH